MLIAKSIAKPLRYKGALLGGLGVMLLMLTIASVQWGAVSLSLGDVWSGDEVARRVVLEIRLPRALLVMLAGGLLAVTGAVIQSLFRNPLADPGLIGVSAGAALAAVGWQVAVTLLGGGLLVSLGMPLAAFLGGMLVTLLVMRIAQTTEGVSSITLLLAGVAINAMAGAGIAGLKYLSDSMTLRQVTFWLMGNVQGVGWWHVVLLTIVAVVCIPWVLRFASVLNLLLLGEQQAQLLGVDTQRTYRQLVLMTALVVGSVVSLVGMIGFVGLVVPHVIRLLFGPDNRQLLPLSFLLGAGLLLFADLLSRTLVAPAELPIGLITALVGSPVFLLMIRAGRRRAG